MRASTRASSSSGSASGSGRQPGRAVRGLRGVGNGPVRKDLLGTARRLGQLRSSPIQLVLEFCHLRRQMRVRARVRARASTAPRAMTVRSRVSFGVGCLKRLGIALALARSLRASTSSRPVLRVGPLEMARPAPSSSTRDPLRRDQMRGDASLTSAMRLSASRACSTAAATSTSARARSLAIAASASDRAAATRAVGVLPSPAHLRPQRVPRRRPRSA